VVPEADAAQDGDLRIIDESGEDYLYTASRAAAEATSDNRYRSGAMRLQVANRSEYVILIRRVSLVRTSALA
jgi:hypothetical protein